MPRYQRTDSANCFPTSSEFELPWRGSPFPPGRLSPQTVSLSSSLSPGRLSSSSAYLAPSFYLFSHSDRPHIVLQQSLWIATINAISYLSQLARQHISQVSQSQHGTTLIRTTTKSWRSQGFRSEMVFPPRYRGAPSSGSASLKSSPSATPSSPSPASSGQSPANATTPKWRLSSTSSASSASTPTG